MPTSPPLAPSRARRRPNRFRPAVEQLEERQLLATGFLQGVAFVSSNGSTQYGPGDSPLPGALIQVFTQNGSQLVAQTTTTANGSYLITGLNPGTYRLVETPPSGYANTGVQTNLSPIDPATAVSDSTIQVTVVDPSQLTATFNANQFFALNQWEAISFTFFGSTKQISIGQLPVTVNGSGISAALLTFCVDLFNDLTAAPANNVFGVLPSPTPTGQNQTPNWGQIGYLYSQYGTTNLSMVDAVGLQLAIYELEYGSNISNFAPLTQYGTTQAEITAALNQAQAYLAASAGQSEPAIFLAANGPLTPEGGQQGVIAPGSLNFANGTSQISPETGGTPPAVLIPVFPMTPQAAPALGLASKVSLFGSNVLGVNGTVSAQAAFVEGVYQNLLNRPADLPGLVAWVTLLQDGFSRQTVVTGIWDSPEHRADEVDQFYVAILHRSPAPIEQTFWVNAMLNGVSEQSVLWALLMSPEYQAAHPSNLDFLDGLYADVVGRAPDAPGLADALQVLNSGVSRAAVATAYLFSTEVEGNIINSYYLAFLHRGATPQEEQLWLGLLQTGQATLESVGEMILASDAYFAQFAAL